MLTDDEITDERALIAFMLKAGGYNFADIGRIMRVTPNQAKCYFKEGERICIEDGARNQNIITRTE